MMLYRANESALTEVFPGYQGRFLHGNGLTIANWQIEAGKAVPSHSHPHEQFITCITGRFEVTVGSVTHILDGGDSIYIPPNIVHSAKSITEVKCIDVFSPKREDYVR